MIGDTRAAQRMLVQGVMAATFQLVRHLRDGQEPSIVHSLIGERRRMLSELARDVNGEEGAGPLAALHAAVAESERTLEALIG